MAVMGESDRHAVFAEYMRDQRVGPMGAILKPDLRAAVDAADSWAQSNAASFNSALPATARNNLTASQKALLLAYVIMKRYDVGA